LPKAPKPSVRRDPEEIRRLERLLEKDLKNAVGNRDWPGVLHWVGQLLDLLAETEA
jgi:hypothetical protein